MKLFLLIFCLVCISITTAQECNEMENTNFIVADSQGIPGYYPFTAGSKTTCSYYCFIVPGCKYWTYRYENQGCLLKKSKGLIKPESGLISGNKACGAAECTRKNDTYTHIAKPLKTKTAKQCTAKCGKSSDCVSWTWNKKEKRCYLIREFDLAERTPWISGNCGVGAYPEEGLMKIGVTCGSGVRREFCFLCGDSFDSCQGTSDHPDCIFTSSGNCIPNNRECVPPYRPGPGPNGPNSLCYYFSNTLVNTWEDAENRCQSMSGSYLAFIETQAQQDFIVKVLDATTSDRAFIGGTSINNTDLTFYWLFTSTAVDDGFTFWGPGEPNFKEEQCMEMTNEKGKYPEPWMWNNIACDKKYPLHSYVCVYDM